MSSAVNYIIIQAGGKGRRMDYLTYNKPKCLISINNKPLLFHLFEHFPQSKFLIITDYKSEVIKTYLSIFGKKYLYKIIETNLKGTLAGIKKALTYIPQSYPFIITWSDLLFTNYLPWQKINLKENYIGLSKTFTCRWRYKNNKFEEIKSKKYGVAGFFIFFNKNQLKNIPIQGEFVRYLKEQKINFNQLSLKNICKEVGTLNSYTKIVKNYLAVRPFNQIIKRVNRIIKKPLDNKGLELISFEKNFYQAIKKYRLNFFPRVIKFSPLTLEKINGNPLFNYSEILNINEKRNILRQIILNLKNLHLIKPPIKANKKNDYEAIIGKTFKRLNEIIPFIPNKDEDYFIINDLKCLNYFKLKEKLIKEMDFFYPKYYHLIHGDLTFSNILYEIKTKKVYFIDPRGYYGNIKLYGDRDYDWAKIYYSLIGNYDHFNRKNFHLKINKNRIELKIKSNNWNSLEDYFFKLTSANKLKVMFYHGIIWLSLTTYVWDNYDSILGAFYNGIYYLQKYYDQKTS